MQGQGTVTAGFRSKNTCNARVRLPPLDVWGTQLEVPFQVFIYRALQFFHASLKCLYAWASCGEYIIFRLL